VECKTFNKTTEINLANRQLCGKEETLRHECKFFIIMQSLKGTIPSVSKTYNFYFMNNSINNQPIETILVYRIPKKNQLKRLWIFPPHQGNVTTLPCEIELMHVIAVAMFRGKSERLLNSPLQLQWPKVPEIAFGSYWVLTIGNESGPKIIINDKFIFKTAISILLISKHNSFRVLFDNNFIWKISLYFSIGNGQHREPALCQLYRHTFVPYT